MSKFFGFLIAAITAFSFSSNANASGADLGALQVHQMLQESFYGSVQQSFADEAEAANLNWVVGDKASYKISGGIINGKIEAFVREDTGTAFWLQQDADLGFMGKQKIEILINKTTGQVEKMLVNGQEQTIPENNLEVIEMKEANVSVSAGEFECIYVKLKDKSNGQIQEAWVNPQAVPISGQIKAISDSQLGKITQELTSFQFAPRE